MLIDVQPIGPKRKKVFHELHEGPKRLKLNPAQHINNQFLSSAALFTNSPLLPTLISSFFLTPSTFSQQPQPSHQIVELPTHPIPHQVEIPSNQPPYLAPSQQLHASASSIRKSPRRFRIKEQARAAAPISSQPISPKAEEACLIRPPHPQC